MKVNNRRSIEIFILTTGVIMAVENGVRFLSAYDVQATEKYAPSPTVISIRSANPEECRTGESRIKIQCRRASPLEPSQGTIAIAGLV